MDPDFVIGGAPKCATTALFDYLAQHPQIYASDPKEPQYFASAPLNRKAMKGDCAKNDYLALFDEKSIGQKSGEASTHYLHHAETVAPFLAAHNANVRLIFCLRDPADRAWSHFLFRYSSAGPFTAGGVGQDMAFEEFLTEPQIFAMGAYAHNLAVFRKHFDAEQILLIFFEDIVKDIRVCLSRMCEHIGVDPGFEFDLAERSNETSYPKFPAIMPLADNLFVPLYRITPVSKRTRLLEARQNFLFSTSGHKTRMSETDRSMAIELYRPSIERLSAETGADLSAWLRPKS